MADSVSVDHGGLSITTNTMTEAALRTEMEAPATEISAPATENSAPAAENSAPVAEKPRDDKGRFARTEAATPPAEAPEAPEPVPEPEPARRRDDTLPKHDPIARMKQALAQKAEADRRAAALEAELARYQRPQGQAPPATAPAATNGHAPTAGFPDWDQWNAANPNDPDPYTSYQDAKWEWRLEQRLAASRAAWETEQTVARRAAQFQAALQTGRTAYPDFDHALTEADTLGLQVSAVMQDAIADSPRAADLVYFLATHPEECIQLAEESRQTPVAAATVMRRFLESRLAPRVPAPLTGTGTGVRASVSTAKPPVTPVGSSPVVSDEPPGESASAAEHSRYWNRKLKVPGAR